MNAFLVFKVAHSGCSGDCSGRRTRLVYGLLEFGLGYRVKNQACASLDARNAVPEEGGADCNREVGIPGKIEVTNHSAI
ncbi:MAG: hypothetical protein RJA30_171, partial [Actinomycetota bacterium]